MTLTGVALSLSAALPEVMQQRMWIVVRMARLDFSPDKVSDVHGAGSSRSSTCSRGTAPAAVCHGLTCPPHDLK